MSVAGIAAFEPKVAGHEYTTVEKRLAPGEALEKHAHDFDAWGLITAGEFRIVDGEPRRYGVGEEFRLDASGQPERAVDRGNG